MKHFIIPIAASLAALLSAESAPAQFVPELYPLRAMYPQTDGYFGFACAIADGIVAVGSREADPVAPNFTGHVSIFERGAGGAWERTQLLKAELPFFQSTQYGEHLTMRGDVLLVASLHHCFEYRRINGVWERIGWFTPPTVPAHRSIWDLDFDGQTVIVGHARAGNAQNQPAAKVLVWEKGTQWNIVTTIEGNHLQEPHASNFGAVVRVDGDLAAVSAPFATVNGVPAVGRVYTFRRQAGTWVLDQVIQHPNPPTPAPAVTGGVFGSGLDLKDGWLFVGAPDDDAAGGLGSNRSGMVYVYRHAPGNPTPWQLHSRITATSGPESSIVSPGFGWRVVFEPPTLLVSAPVRRLPITGPFSPMGGAGTVYRFELCGDVWNQSIALTAPHNFGGAGLGRSLASDGNHVVAGGINFHGYPTSFAQFGHPRAGIAAVASLGPPSSATECTEVGRSYCAPFELETADCPCGAVAVQGRGCPNGASPGARLYAHGGFDQVRIRRVLVDGLPPASLTLLAISRPSAGTLPGATFGNGVACIPAPATWLTATADANGAAVFENVPALDRSHLQCMAGLQWPLQALYRSPSAGACGSDWNASNGLLFTINAF